MFAPDIKRTLQQTGPAENGLCVATQVIRDKNPTSKWQDVRRHF